MGRRIKKEVEKNDVQLAADCLETSYYGLATGDRLQRVYFLTKCDGKWVWASVGADRNYSRGCTSFEDSMEKALSIDGNKLIVFTERSQLFTFMVNPNAYLTGQGIR